MACFVCHKGSRAVLYCQRLDCGRFIALRASEIDSALRARSEVPLVHQWVWVVIDDVSREYCSQCGKPKDDCRLSDSTYNFHPCRGLIG